jgi:P-type Ca2+ transporter type 2C
VPALSGLQALWVNLIIATLAAMCLAADVPILDRRLEGKTPPIVSFSMWKMIYGQTIFHVALLLILHFAGPTVFVGWTTQTLQTVKFNTYSWLQIFNVINCRSLDSRLNVFSYLLGSIGFQSIFLVMAGCQIIIIYVGGYAFSSVRVGGTQWATSMILGVLCLPFGAIWRIFPNELLRFGIPNVLSRKRRRRDEEAAVDAPRSALDDIRDELLLLKSLGPYPQRFNLTGTNTKYSPVRVAVMLPVLVVTSITSPSEVNKVHDNNN